MYNVVVSKKGENEMEKMSVKEFEDVFGDDIENVKLFEDIDAVAVYISSNDENPYVGVEYIDGRFSIVGCRADCEVSYEEMCAMLYED